MISAANLLEETIKRLFPEHPIPILIINQQDKVLSLAAMMTNPHDTTSLGQYREPYATYQVFHGITWTDITSEHIFDVYNQFDAGDCNDAFYHLNGAGFAYYLPAWIKIAAQDEAYSPDSQIFLLCSFLEGLNSSNRNSTLAPDYMSYLSPAQKEFIANMLKGLSSHCKQTATGDAAQRAYDSLWHQYIGS